MALSRSRLDKFVSEKLNIKRKDVRLVLAQKRVQVNDCTITDCDFIIDKFSTISIDKQLVQNNVAHYVMLNKPVGVVSATKDDIHKTVVDLINFNYKQQLHIVGRLDLNSSGLLLLTNDSRWSQKLMLPEAKVQKCYLVTVAKPLTAEMVIAFEQGMHFSFENITTKPAKLEILSTFQAKVSLSEGKYHQIKRMFGRFRNPVVAIHRQSIGALELDVNLDSGQARELTPSEVKKVFDR